ncbi:MAG: signal peptidase II [Proteobacteria bacterium]|nr:signal peptidase II [Pseudomonadota bacterium]
MIGTLIYVQDVLRLLRLLNRKYKLLLIITSLIVISDQVAKIFVDRTMHLYQSIEVLENFFHITYIRNKGAAFGMLSGADSSLRVPFFLVMSTLAIGVIVYIIHKDEGKRDLFPITMALILGGAIGNMIDRLRLGEVIDFLDVHWYQHHWPAFNIADSAITVGAGLLILYMFKERKS